VSLPLGALRLSEKFARKDNKLQKKDITELQKEILRTLPDSSELEFDNNTRVVGVGGSIRAIASYDQKIRKYPLNILHNYVMDYRSIQLVKKKLSKMDSNDIADIDAIGSNRAFSITAASILINTMLQKFKLESVVVSTHGLREGYLTECLNSSTNMQSVRLDTKRLRNHFRDKYDPNPLPKTSSKFVQMLCFGIMKIEDYEIFVNAKQKLSERFVDLWQPDITFNLIIHDVFPGLSHEEQVILALSIIFRRKPKVAEKMSVLYGTILKRQNKKSIQKIAVCIDFTDIFERYASRVDLLKDDTGSLTVKIISKTKFFPEHMLNKKVKLFESAFDIGLVYTNSRP
jgi:exopolyphosphatase / guanosine-5'-triphosphate,3'-diphosphate pyrophosphatase